jgi:hypothetical protein
MIQTLSTAVSASRQNPKMGYFRSPRKVLRIYVEVLEAFNSDGTDTLVIGHGDDPDAYATSINVSTTWVKTVTLGSGVNYDATPRAVIAAYTAGGSAPTTGSVIILIEYAELPRQN